jgi:hypothetical protein
MIFVDLLLRILKETTNGEVSTERTVKNLQFDMTLSNLETSKKLKITDTDNIANMNGKNFFYCCFM